MTRGVVMFFIRIFKRAIRNVDILNEITKIHIEIVSYYYYFLYKSLNKPVIVKFWSSTLKWADNFDPV